MGLFTPVWKKEGKSAYNRSCNVVEKTNDQKKLLEIAINAYYLEVRILAVGKLWDEKMLTQFAAFSPHEKIREVAIRKIDYEQIFEQIALSTPYEDSKCYAIQQISNRIILDQITLNQNETTQVRITALSRIKDRKLFEKITKNEPDWQLRKTAYTLLGNKEKALEVTVQNDPDNHIKINTIKEISDLKLLEWIVKNDKSDSVCLAAVEKIDHQPLLEKIAVNHNLIPVIRTKAIEKITNPQLLDQIIKLDNDHTIIKAVIDNKFVHPKTLVKIIFNETLDEIPYTALEKLTDRNHLEKVARESKSWYVRYKAWNKLGNSMMALVEEVMHSKIGYDRHLAAEALDNQESYFEIFNNDSHQEGTKSGAKKISKSQFFADIIKNTPKSDRYHVSELLFEKITDPGIFAEFAQSKQYGVDVQCLAIDKISDQHLLAQLARNEKDSLVRCAAISNLKDQKTLNEIILNDNELEVKIDAYKNLNIRNEAIIHAFQGLRKSPFYQRKSFAEDLIRLLSKDSFAAGIFWEKASKISEIEHTDSIFAHKDIGHSSNDCGHTDETPHQDTGIGVKFPPYPFND